MVPDVGYTTPVQRMPPPQSDTQYRRGFGGTGSTEAGRCGAAIEPRTGGRRVLAMRPIAAQGALPPLVVTSG